MPLNPWWTWCCCLNNAIFREGASHLQVSLNNFINKICSSKAQPRALAPGPDQAIIKRYMKLLIARMVVTLPPGETSGKTGAVLTGLHNKTAARTPPGVLTAVNFWLPFVN
jgi:hypothetical protein